MRVLIFLLSALSAGFGQDQCRTPNGDGGTCKALEECDPLNKINQIKDKSTEESLILKQSHCDSKTLKPTVCCPHKNQWQNFNSTTATPSIENDERCKATVKPPLHQSYCCGVQEYREPRFGVDEFAGVDQYPWVALLKYNETDRRIACGGALISARYVLTAAHCLGNTRRGYADKVLLAEYDLSSYPIDNVEAIGGGYEQVSNVIIAVESQLAHPGYVRSKQPVPHDIGLVKMTKNAPYNDFIRPICLPTQDVYPTDSNINFFISGWGTTGISQTSIIKQHNTLVSVPITKCKDAYHKINRSELIYDTHICAGSENDKGTCVGDSGGPLMYSASVDAPWVITGVTTFGDRNCVKNGKPDVYTNVYKYLDWITEHMV